MLFCTIVNFFTFVEPLKHVITVRGQTSVSRTGDDPLQPVCPSKIASVCTLKTSPCVPAPRAHVFQHMCPWCRHTRRGFECTHGGDFEAKYVMLHVFFSVPQHTNTHTHQTHTTTTTTHTTQHNTQHHTERERRRSKKTERETRQEKTREDDTRQEDKTRM